MKYISAKKCRDKFLVEIIETKELEESEVYELIEREGMKVITKLPALFNETDEDEIVNIFAS